MDRDSPQTEQKQTTPVTKWNAVFAHTTFPLMHTMASFFLTIPQVSSKTNFNELMCR
jgi:hypothetical protein